MSLSWGKSGRLPWWLVLAALGLLMYVLGKPKPTTPSTLSEFLSQGD